MRSTRNANRQPALLQRPAFFLMVFAWTREARSQFTKTFRTQDRLEVSASRKPVSVASASAAHWSRSSSSPSKSGCCSAMAQRPVRASRALAGQTGLFTQYIRGGPVQGFPGTIIFGKEGVLLLGRRGIRDI